MCVTICDVNLIPAYSKQYLIHFYVIKFC